MINKYKKHSNLDNKYLEKYEIPSCDVIEIFDDVIVGLPRNFSRWQPNGPNY